MRTQDRLVERLKAGIQVIEDAQVPQELQPVAFRHALEALGGEGSSPEVPLHSGDEGGSPKGLLVGAIASRLNLDLDVVTHVFEEEGDQIHLIVTKNKLPNAGSKAASMRDVALLLAAGRQVASIEDYTAASLIRRECEELGVLDSSNFAVELGRLGMRARGGPKSKAVRASRHQLEQASKLVLNIAGRSEK